MSGHSKWSTIKRKKGALDQKRGKLFSSMGREITISTRLFGSDIDTNARLRQAIKKAKSINMPNANIDKAIKKGAGELENIIYEEASYEGYGPNGVAIFIETITDNKNRTVAEIRHVLSKFGGSLGQNGSVAWNFEKTGVVLIEDSNMTEEEALNLSIKVDAVDFKLEDKYFTIFFDHDILYEKIELIEKGGLEIDSSSIELFPKNFVEVSEENFLTINKLIDSLEDLEDIQNVYSNYRVEKN
ncbi:MAG: YebC/PmpR family DNA-binding transcriptional regulator [Candidatus Neomarinimicrobiota bacterium]|nr:YebC/PmpR family DNA-binding transcriptional regulator [Candidatus Neomarinimicrobiota bacterium]MEE3241980.1 YebC/PmpR family DNA-binding transcriptional regulator [Candidatus Neomarinimicrobiota bacterium]